MPNYLAFRDDYSITDLERLVAEHEHNLSFYYVGRELYVDRALERTDLKSIFYGPKGVGKSAILKMVKLEETTRGNESRLIEVKPDDLAFNALANLQSTTPLLKDSSSQQFLFKALWNYVLCSELLQREFRDRNSMESLLDKVFGGRHKAEQNKLLNITLKDDGSPLGLTGKILALVDAVEVAGKDANGNTLSGKLKVSAKGGVQNLDLLQLINTVTRSLRDNLSHDYFVLIDDLDLDWDGSLLQSVFIGSMFHAIRTLSMDNEKVKFVVSLRKEIYREIDIPHRDKFGEFVQEVTWSKKAVGKMVEERVAFVLNCGSEAVWGGLFPTGSFEFLYRLTGGMPREMIRLAVACIRTAQEEFGRDRVLADDINKGVEAFSEQRIDDLGSDFRQYPRLSTLLKLFRGMEKEFDSSGIETVAFKLVEKLGDEPEGMGWASVGTNDPVQLARTLLRTGFLLYKSGESDQPRVPVEDDIVLLDKQAWFSIHPMYHAGLGLVNYEQFRN